MPIRIRQSPSGKFITFDANSVPTAEATSVGLQNTAGGADTLTRSDHDHEVIGIVEQGGPTPLPIGAINEGEVLMRFGGEIVGYVPPGGGAVPGDNPVDVDKAPAVGGVSALYSRDDHKHDIATAAAVGVSNVTPNAEGTSTSLARADHTHAVTGFAALTALAPADVTKSAPAVGVGTTAARSDHKHDVSTAAAVGVSNVTPNAEGTSTSLARADHTHAVTGFAALTALAPADVTKSAPAVGVGTTAARSDHKHDVSTAAAVAVSNVTPNAEGTSTSLARADHTHAVTGFAALTALAPADVTKSAAVVGVGTTAARSDHKHDVSTAAAVGLTSASTNTEGVATTLARSDHTHEVGGTSLGAARLALITTTPISANSVPGAIPLDSNEFIAGLGIAHDPVVNNTRIVATRPCIFTLYFRLQFERNIASTSPVVFWVRRNGIDIPRTAARYSVNAASVQQSQSFLVRQQMATNDYLEIIATCVDVTVGTYSVTRTAAVGAIPETPAAIASILAFSLE